MEPRQTALSRDVAQIVKRLFTNAPFREDALTNPELAFEGYSLEPEEREALKSLVGKMGRGDPLFASETPKSFWWP